MEYIWTTRDGRKINVDNMDINHLRNALKMLMRVRVAEKAQRPEKVKRVEMHGEFAQEHADAYEVYKATGVDMLNDEHWLNGEGI
jgi:hypothetical protein